MNTNPIIFYHNDLDGHCSGAIAKLTIPPAEMREINYGHDFPWDEVGGRDVYMLDYSLDAEDMIRLRDTCQLTWIDHHYNITKQVNDLCGANGQIEGLRSYDGWAACELSWRYFVNPTNDFQMPLAVRLAGIYDTQGFKQMMSTALGKQALHFQYGMRGLQTDPKNQSTVDNLWSALLLNSQRDQFARDIAANGRLVFEYQLQRNAKLMESYSFPAYLWGYKVLAANLPPGSGSVTFESVWDNKKYDIMCMFAWDGDYWRYSLYTDKPGIDVSEIARKFGGNGHAQAAGFRRVDLAF